MTDHEILAAVAAGESLDWEFKSARGGFPANVWETYSAMANTDGGTIVLGVGEANGGFSVEGLKNPAQALKTCWDSVNDRGKVSSNLLGPHAARVVSIEGREVLVIEVPRADRRQRPVFVGQNPLTGTYRRNYEGDYRCQPDEVGRMLADQVQEPADSRMLPHFGVADLDAESLRQYRNRFSARNSSHAWLNEDSTGFLVKLGGWGKNRQTGEEGLTVAGLLMFGSENALNDAATGLKYHLDYRERPNNSIADRWTDRVTIDGTWVPNLFQFFQRVYPKLIADLKLPFAYLRVPSSPTAPEDPWGGSWGGSWGKSFGVPSDPVRAGQSPAHEAIQEALVNALIHADYRGVGGVVIERFPDRIEMSNPGSLLVSFEQLRQGGVSECRNPSLQKMFQMIGAGDKAGSGVDKIRRGWETQHWRSPEVRETTQPDRVRIVLPMVSLVPTESEARLRRLFSADYDSLTPLEVQTLATADLEGEVSNGRLQLIRTEHPGELTKMLQSLTSRGFLDQVGQKRGATYRLPILVQTPPPAMRGSPESRLHPSGGTPPLPGGTPPLPERTPPLPESTPPLPESTPPLEGATQLASARLPAQVGETSPEEDRRLLEIAQPAREKPRLMPERTKQILRELCRGRFLTANQIGTLMSRGPEKLREKFLSPMVESGELPPAIP